MSIRCLLLGLMATVTVASTGAAITHEIARPQVPIAPDAATELRAQEEVRQLARRTGANWRVWDVNGATGTVHLAYGSGVDLGLGAVTTESTAHTAALSFVTDHPEFFHVAPSDLELWSAGRTPDKWGLNYHQLHSGLRVLGGRATVALTDEGRVIVAGSDIYRGIDLDTVPAISLGTARDIAAGTLEGTVRDGAAPGELMILPVHHEESVSHHLVWQVEHWTRDPVGHWFSYVDAHTGDIRWRQSEIRHAQVAGTVKGVFEDRDFCDGVTTAAFPGMRVEIAETGEADTTDANGYFSIPSGFDPVNVRVALSGPWVDVNRDNSLPEPTDPVLSFVATPVAHVSIEWDSLFSRWDERDCFIHVNRAHDYIKYIDPTFTGVDYQMPCTVGIDNSCNAYWDGNGINFYREQNGCANTGRLASVIYHEYTHGITYHMYGGSGNLPPAMLNEGNSDIMANLMEKRSLFFNGRNLVCDEGLRDADNDLCWPEDSFSGDPYHNGQMLSGFIWDSRENLIASYGDSVGHAMVADLWHFGRKMGLPFSFEDQIFWTFVADDDNGDLDDGTPNYGDLCEAAENHCFACPDFGVEIRFEPYGPLVAADTPVALTAKIWSTLADIDLPATKLTYTVAGDSPVELPLTENPADSTYTATIPGQPAGAIVTYHITATDEIGTVGTEPVGAPGAVHTLYVEPAVWDDFEDDRGWTVGIPGDDATEGIWELVEPIGTWQGARPLQPAFDHSVPGTQCFVTGQQPDGTSNPDTADVEGGTTTLVSPLYNLTGATLADVCYFRWHSDDIVGSQQEEFWVVQVRNNLDTWIDLENTTDADNSWLHQTFDLIALFGQDIGLVEFRFQASDLPPIANLVEAALDDFFIVSDVGGGQVGIDPVSGDVPRVTSLAAPRPNPMRASTSIRYRLATADAVRLDVYDVTGRRVRRLVDARQAAGHYAIRWDGRSDDGRQVGAGVFFTELRVGGLQQVRKLIVVR